jgi:phenylacetate-CoA ligase
LEVVSDGKRGLDDGIGSIIVTLTTNRLMPLIRYEVGDLGRMLQHDCPCELSDWQCFEFHGRRQDAMRVADRWITTKHVDDVVSTVPGIDFYQCLQRNGADLLIKIIPTRNSSVDDIALANVVKGSLGFNSVSVRHVSRLEPEPSMKTRLSVPNHETTQRAE